MIDGARESTSSIISSSSSFSFLKDTPSTSCGTKPYAFLSSALKTCCKLFASASVDMPGATATFFVLPSYSTGTDGGRSTSDFLPRVKTGMTKAWPEY